MKHTIVFALIFALLTPPSYAGRGFAGTDKILATGSAVDVHSGGMTISIWFYATSADGVEHDFGDVTTQWGAGIGWGCSGCSTTAVNYTVGDNSPLFSTYGQCGPGTAPLNSWHNIILLTDAGTAGATMDGTGCSGSGSWHETRVSHTTATLGGKDSTTANFKGRLAEVGIWNVQLTTAETKALNAGVSPAYIRRANLVAYWPLYGAGSVEPDFSGNSANGVLTGTTTTPHCPCGFPPNHKQ